MRPERWQPLCNRKLARAWACAMFVLLPTLGFSPRQSAAVRLLPSILQGYSELSGVLQSWNVPALSMPQSQGWEAGMVYSSFGRYRPYPLSPCAAFSDGLNCPTMQVLNTRKNNILIELRFRKQACLQARESASCCVEVCQAPSPDVDVDQDGVVLS